VKRSGLTLLEVMLALAIMGIAIAFFTTSMSSSLRQTKNFGQRTQATQVLNYLARRAVTGDALVLPNANETNSWDYGKLGTYFTDLKNQKGFSKPGLYRASVASVGTINLSTASAIQYDVEVCYKSSGGETCIGGTTLGPPPNPPGAGSTCETCLNIN